MKFTIKDSFSRCNQIRKCQLWKDLRFTVSCFNNAHARDHLFKIYAKFPQS